MNEENISGWVEKAKANASGSNAGSSESGVKVIRNEAVKNRGAIIMAIADALRPHLTKLFTGVRDEHDMLAQPAHIRAFALNMAQNMVSVKEQNNAAA